MKHSIKFLLSLVFLIPFVSCSSETELDSDIIFITSESELWAMAGDTANYDKHYVLTRDLDLGGADWSPIGNTSNQFAGIFDGAGFKISGVYINEPAAWYQGFFGYLGAGAVVKDLGVAVNITGGQIVGGIAGQNYGTISGSHSEGNITASSNAGGIAGENQLDAMISNSYSTGNITATAGDYAGGIAGWNASNATISDSYSTGKIEANEYAGGIVGSNASNATISDSYSTGKIEANEYAGGIVGLNQIGATISNSYSTGNITATTGDYAGGIAGMNDYIISNSYSTGDITADSAAGGIAGHNSINATISTSYSTGDITATTGSYAGGIAGWNETNAAISNSYSTGDITATTNYAGGIAGLNNPGGTISNCAALNNIITGGAAAGRITGANAGSLTNNHAFDGMEVNSSQVTQTDPTHINGADVSKGTTAGQISSPAFWSGTMGFNATTSDWNLDFSTRLYKLPWLLNMPLKPDGTSGQPTTLPQHLR